MTDLFPGRTIADIKIKIEARDFDIFHQGEKRKVANLCCRQDWQQRKKRKRKYGLDERGKPVNITLVENQIDRAQTKTKQNIASGLTLEIYLRDQRSQVRPHGRRLFLSFDTLCRLNMFIQFYGPPAPNQFNFRNDVAQI